MLICPPAGLHGVKNMLQPICTPAVKGDIPSLVDDDCASAWLASSQRPMPSHRSNLRAIPEKGDDEAIWLHVICHRRLQHLI